MQAVLSGGLVVLAVLPSASSAFSSDAGNGSASRSPRRDWWFIGLTGGGANDPERVSLSALIAVEGAIFAVGVALVRVSTRRHVLPRVEGSLLGAAAGIEAGNGVLSSISYFDTSEHADESTRLASNWVRDQRLETVLNAPKITSGEVVVHSERRPAPAGLLLL